MSESKNLMGLNLNVDSELMAEAAKEAIIAGVASGLEMKESLVSEFVKSMLSEQVRISGLEMKESLVSEFVKSMLSEQVRIEDGRTKQYSSDKCCSRMEYIVRKAFSDIVREEIAKMLEEQKPVLRELIRKEFQKKQVQSQFVEMFMASLADSVTDRYSTTINVEFAAKKERY